MTSPEARIAELGLQLPDVVAPLAAYVPATRSGSLIFTSGQLPLIDGELMAKGLVGVDVDAEQAASCARICALNALAAVRSLTGDLSQVSRVVKVVGYVASSPDFSGQPAVVNGASSLFGEVFGDAGFHARSAVGVASLPLGAPVEIEMIVEVA
jgi:enamine deaminase RidA (YjgF/YER057c/UK114 family)